MFHMLNQVTLMKPALSTEISKKKKNSIKMTTFRQILIYFIITHPLYHLSTYIIVSLFHLCYCLGRLFYADYCLRET